MGVCDCSKILGVLRGSTYPFLIVGLASSLLVVLPLCHILAICILNAEYAVRFWSPEISTSQPNIANNWFKFHYLAITKLSDF